MQVVGDILLGLGTETGERTNSILGSNLLFLPSCSLSEADSSISTL